MKQKGSFFLGTLVWLLTAVWAQTPLLAQEKLGLEEAIKLALAQSPEIRIAQLELEQAREQNTWGAAGALPQVNLTGNRNHQWTDIRQRFASGLVVDRAGVASNQTNLGLGVAWTFYDGGRMFADKKGRELLVSMAAQRLENVRFGLIDSVSQAFFQVVQAQLDLEITLSEQSRIRERLALVREQVRIGFRTRADEVQALIDLNQNAIRLAQQELALENRKAGLNGILTRSPETPFDPLWRPEPFPKAEYESLKAQAMTRNSGLALLRASKTALDLEKQQVKARGLPSLNLNTGYAYGRNESKAGFALFNQSLGPSVGLSFSAPLFTGFPVRKALSIAHKETNKREEEIRLAENRMQTRLWRLVKTLGSQIRQEDQEAESIQLARELEQLVTGRFRLGQATSLELREAETLLRQAQTRKSQLDVQIRLTWSQIQRLTQAEELPK